MYKHLVKVYGEDLIAESAVPQNTSLAGTNVISAGGTMASLQAVMLASEAVTITAAKAITLEILEDASKDGAFTSITGSKSITAPTGNLSVPAGEVIMRVPLTEQTKDYIKAKVTTDDTAASGKIAVILEYLPR